MLLSDLIILSCKLPSILDVFTFDNMINENLFFVSPKLLFLLANGFVLVIVPFRYLFFIWALASTHITLIVFLAVLVLFGVHPSASAIHNSHQGFLMTSKVDFI